MGKRKRVQYELDTGDIKELKIEDIKAILRAADEIIATAGRGMLVKILKGSKDKKLLEHGLNECPTYGYFNHCTMTVIGHMVDWMLKNLYLKIEYDGKLPMIVFTKEGWEIEKETFIAEVKSNIVSASLKEEYEYAERLKDFNRDVILEVLSRIAADQENSTLIFLREWQEIEVRKVREKIERTIQLLMVIK